MNNKAIKNINHVELPESYRPKNPSIIELVAATKESYPDFSEFNPSKDELKIYYLPPVRVIGKEVRSGGKLGNTAPAFWSEVKNSDDYSVLLEQPQVLQGAIFGWTCDYDKETDTFIYIVSTMTPKDTPVPEGFVYRDIPATLCAKGTFGEDISVVINKSKEMGYTTNWEPYGWNAELYIIEEWDNPPKDNCNFWRWLVPVKEAKKVTE